MINKHILRADLKRLNEAYKKNNLVIFVGAGVSMNSNIPNWENLVNELAKELPESFQNDSDKLRTVQLYKNNRGEKEYLDKVRSVLKHNKTTPNAIHKAILDLNPEHIITTNYDDLIEQEALNRNKLYYPITKDKDLAYSTHNKYIIKMHGDLSVGNIVLSEDDYINYSNNFPLIETFVKSLFTSKLILFIGFSFTDYNLKVITSKVKNILQADFQPMYLFNPETPDIELQKYYERQGIKSISYDSKLYKIEDTLNFVEKMELKELYDSRAIHIYMFLKSIKHYNSIESELTSQHIMERLNNFIKNNFDEVRILGAENLIKIAPINLKNSHYDKGYLSFENEELLIFRKKLQNCFSAKREFLKNYKNIHKNIVQKMAFNGIYFISQKKFEHNDKFKSLQRWAKINEDNLDVFYNLNFTQSLDTINNLKIIGKTDVSISNLELPFLQFKMGYTYEAYLNYKELSKLSWKQGKYILYFICQFNLKSLRGSLFSNDNLSKEENTLIDHELRSINLTEILNSINFEDDIYYKLLEGLKNFKHIFDRFKRISKRREDIAKSKDNIENGGFSLNSNIENVWNDIADIWNFSNNNFILSEHYQDHKFIYQKAIESTFISYSIKNNTDPKMESSKLSEIAYFHIIIILFNYNSNELLNILDKIKIRDIKINDKEFSRLKLSTENLLNSLEVLEKFTEKTKKVILDVFKSILIIYSRLNLEIEDIDKMISVFLKKEELTGLCNKSLSYFLDCHSKAISTKKLEKLLIISIKHRHNNEIDLDLERNLARTLYLRDKNYKIKDIIILNSIIKEEIIKSHLRWDYELVLYLNYIFPEKYQKKVSKYLNDSFNKAFESNDTQRFCLAYEQKNHLQQKAKDNFIYYCEQYFNNTKIKISLEGFMIYTLKLMYHNKEKIDISILRKSVPIIDFVLSPNSFSDIKSVEKDWFYYLNEKEVKKLNQDLIKRLKELIQEYPNDKILLKILLIN